MLRGTSPASFPGLSTDCCRNRYLPPENVAYALSAGPRKHFRIPQEGARVLAMGRPLAQDGPSATHEACPGRPSSRARGRSRAPRSSTTRRSSSAERSRRATSTPTLRRDQCAPLPHPNRSVTTILMVTHDRRRFVDKNAQALSIQLEDGRPRPRRAARGGFTKCSEVLDGRRKTA